MVTDSPYVWDEEDRLLGQLRTYQRDGVEFLLLRDSALLADEMGLGKTVQAAVALQLCLRRPGFRRALIVCPSGLRLNWERELTKWAPDLTVRRVQGSSVDREAYYRLPIPVLIVSYEQVRIDIPSLANFVSFDIVLLDEAQRIKNRHSETNLACTIIQRRVSWALTATPVENSPNDLVSVLSFVRPGLATPGLPRNELHRRMQPYFLRRRKSEVIPELPPIIDQVVPLELEGPQRDAYSDLWETRTQLVQPDSYSEVNMLALITRLKQLCNYHEGSGTSAKAEVLFTILDSARESGDKVLVFSQYVETLEWLRERWTESPSAIYHGGLNDLERDAVLRKFEEGVGSRVLFISLRAGGVGLNLQAASTVVLFDRWWNPAVEDQAIQRAHRFGRQTPLYVVRFIVENSIEDRIARILEDKRMTIDEYTEQAGSAVSTALTRSELARILDLPQHVDENDQLVGTKMIQGDNSGTSQ